MHGHQLNHGVGHALSILAGVGLLQGLVDELGLRNRRNLSDLLGLFVGLGLLDGGHRQLGLLLQPPHPPSAAAAQTAEAGEQEQRDGGDHGDECAKGQMVPADLEAGDALIHAGIILPAAETLGSLAFILIVNSAKLFHGATIG